MKVWTAFLVLVVALVVAPACVKRPPNLGPAASLAWQQHEIQKNLDIIRDIAQDGSTTVPPVISIDDARKVTTWHRSAIIVIHDAAAGWVAAVLSSLQQLKNDLSAAAQAKLGGYFDLAIGVVKGFTS